MVKSEVLNVGAKLRLGFLSAGVGMFNISLTPGAGENWFAQFANAGIDAEHANYMATVAIDIKLGGKAPAKK